MFRFLTKKMSDIDTTTNYLDDFLMSALMEYLCNTLMNSFLEMCQKLRVLIAQDKTEKANTIMVFLGILMDGEWYVLVVPEEKCVRSLNELLNLLDKKKATVKELQSITSLLNFLNRAIYPGRAFTR